jgi:hypothetical protein
MKTYKELNQIEKAQLLHQWFPGEINHFLSFAQEVARDILSKPGSVPEGWKRRKIDAVLWAAEAEILLKKIEDTRERLIKDSAFFSVTLFKWFLDFFPHYCLLEYTVISPNQKMMDAIQFLFES